MKNGDWENLASSSVVRMEVFFSSFVTTPAEYRTTRSHQSCASLLKCSGKPSMSEVQAIRDQLVTTFAGHRTRNIQFRIAQLQSLQRFLRDYRDLIASALHSDLHKPSFDAHGEVLACLTEVDYVTQRLEEWMKPVQTPLPLTLAPASSFIQYEPLGTCLIIGPFNFPIVLTVGYNTLN